MSRLEEIFQRPIDLNDASAATWFAEIAELLCNGVQLFVGGEAHRFTELEFYYFHKEDHPDYFAHRDPLQLEMARWYFHRVDGGGYKAGSFKGLDISFGDGVAYGGVLIRGMEKSDGSLIDGPCLCVNHMLALSEIGKVGVLDEEIGGRPVWDTTSPLHLVETDVLAPKELYTSARVGLTLKRSFPGSNMPQYVVRPYRFLTEPRGIKKGKVLLTSALIRAGLDIEAIRGVTGSPRKTVQNYMDAFDEGKALEDFRSFVQKDLKSADLARLHGAYEALRAE